LLAFGWVTSGGKTYMARSKNVCGLGSDCQCLPCFALTTEIYPRLRDARL
jgi:hypothetical protein